MYDNQVCSPEDAARIAIAERELERATKRRKEDFEAWSEARANYRALIAELPTWQEEVCYFGSAVWPSEQIYRIYGSRVQRRIDFLGVPNDKAPDGIAKQYSFEESRNIDVITDCEDVRLQVSDSKRADIHLFGWLELTTKEDFERYERDKRDAM